MHPRFSTDRSIWLSDGGRVVRDGQFQSQWIILLGMKYPSDSAIQNHYLQAILPHPPYPQPKQFLKTKEFYKPEQFIWNNPHRASDRMYRFYHAYNDQYVRDKEPLLRQLEQHDRQEAEMQRIHRLIAFRNKAREEFQDKQRTREVLEERVRNDSTPFSTAPRTATRPLPTEAKYKSHSTINNDKLPPADTRSRKDQQSERVLRVEDAYRAGLRKYDERVEEINRLIGDQNEQFHSKLRSEFAARKLTNDLTNSKFYPKRHQDTRDARDAKQEARQEPSP